MNLDELNELSKTQAEADEELNLFQKSQTEYQPLKSLEAELSPDHVVSELKGIAQDMAKYHAEYNENRRADEIKTEKDKKHCFRHDFFVAAFSIALTLFFEHIHDVIKFALEFLRLLF